ncbi:hypothetical protein DFS33DRAFT_1277422 [Desarmillaria ectypa]|nr:hypothetical protein DFS33DRAFT_1277422 [Desarmillaria ectypa]
MACMRKAYNSKIPVNVGHSMICDGQAYQLPVKTRRAMQDFVETHDIRNEVTSSGIEATDSLYHLFCMLVIEYKKTDPTAALRQVLMDFAVILRHRRLLGFATEYFSGQDNDTDTMPRDLERLVWRADCSDPDNNFKGFGKPEGSQVIPHKRCFCDDQAPQLSSFEHNGHISSEADASDSKESEEWIENDYGRKMVTLLDEDSGPYRVPHYTVAAEESEYRDQALATCSGPHIESAFGSKKKRRQETLG